ncbi:MAG: efflux RND transporter permease subunit, partial [Caulobacterales bacterium]|nr:efflux RND transporter permease subunit [Caulobacterales bacterium]
AKAELEAYGITYDELFRAVSENNRLVTAGALETGPGRFQIKVRGLFESAGDALSLSIRADDEAVVTLGDVASVRRTFKDRDVYARFNGKPALALQVSKRIGTNLIDTTAAIRERTAEVAADWPDTVEVAYSLDQSVWITDSLAQLGASITTAVLLVMIVVVAVLGVRSGLLVGIAIPSSFMLSFLLLGIFGLTVNFMVLFGMVLAVGMLVDAGIVVVEYADRKLAEGLSKQDAFAMAGKRMFWPIISSTATTLAAFLPFLFWDTMPGQYMSVLPKTLIFVLTSSLVMALIFLPVVGSIFGGRPKSDTAALQALSGADGDPLRAPGLTGLYARLIARLIRHPLAVVAIAVAIVWGVFSWFGSTDHRLEFFVDTEPEQVQAFIRARGNLSPAEQDAIGQEAEALIADLDGVKSIYTTAGEGGGGGFFDNPPPEDAIATLFVDFLPHGERRNGRVLQAEITERLSVLPGVFVEVRPPESGPPVGKDIQVVLRSGDAELLDAAARKVRDQINHIPGLIEIEDTLPLPGVEWDLRIDREMAGRFGVDVTELGAAVQLVTDGVLLGRYRPDDSEDEIDIRVRFSETARDINQLDALRVATAEGMIPIANFVERTPAPQVDRIARRDGKRVIEVRANATEGYAANLIIDDLKAWLDTADIDPAVSVGFGGADEETQEAGAFFVVAMAAALFMMGAILLLQFNNFWHIFLTLLAVVLSITGVLLGIQLTFPYISVLMVGTGVVALAGIVVNNNIVLIDTYQRLRSLGYEPEDAVVRTAAQRARPVLLTTITTICGLLPMVFQINANFLTGEITSGGFSAEMWVPLSSAVVWGLGFSTLLTLVLTPTLLAVPARIARGRDRITGAARP